VGDLLVEINAHRLCDRGLVATRGGEDDYFDHALAVRPSYII
jgi:hypothetical protein